MIPDDLESIRTKRKRWQIPILGMSILELLFLLGLVFFIRSYVFQLFRVSGPSMCPTLNQIDGKCEFGAGELIFVNQLGYSFFNDPGHDDIVVFTSPVENIFVVKRVIGIPGDTITIKSGKVYRTNEAGTDVPVDEYYLDDSDSGKTRTYGVNTFTVPEGKYFLMGDNRDHSQDGRHCYRGSHCPNPPKTEPFIDEKYIRGEAVFVLYPFDIARKLGRE